MATVYLIHLHHKLAHAGHYVGWCNGESPQERFLRHKAGGGARMLQVCNEVGIDYAIVRVWEFATWQEARDWERRIKRRHGSACLCPLCNHTQANHLYVQSDI